MNTTVVIVVPEWAVWLFVLIAVVSLIDSGLKIYNQILQKRLAAAAIGQQEGEG